MKIIILTGGIATGKSTVCNILKNKGYITIDSDKIAKNIIKKNKKVYKKIINIFGQKILKNNNSLNRTVLSKIIFNNPIKRKQLNKIMHPHIIKTTNKILKSLYKTNINHPIIIDIPLFFEIFKKKVKTNSILIYTPINIQIKRLIKRDKISKTDAITRLNAQISIEKKIKLASNIINNSGSIKKTKKLIELIFKTYPHIYQ